MLLKKVWQRSDKKSKQKRKKIILFRPAWFGKRIDSWMTEVSGEDEKQQSFTNSVLYFITGFPSITLPLLLTYEV